jgi:hypothetical protein
MSILFHHYKELTECSKQVEQMMMNRKRSVKVVVQDLPKVEEEEKILC